MAEVSDFQGKNVGWVIKKNSNGRWIARKAKSNEYSKAYATKAKADEMVKRFNK